MTKRSLVQHALRLVRALGAGSLGLLLFVLSGCGGLSIDMTTLRSNLSSTPDFLKTEVLVNGSGIADGVNDLVVVVRLMNSNNTVVVGHRPSFVVESGPSVFSSVPCSLSDANGGAICLLRATVPGARVLRIDNIGNANVQANILFTAPIQSRSNHAVLAGASIGTSAQGYRVETKTGRYRAGLKYQSPEGYVVDTWLRGGPSQ